MPTTCACSARPRRRKRWRRSGGSSAEARGQRTENDACGAEEASSSSDTVSGALIEAAWARSLNPAQQGERPEHLPQDQEMTSSSRLPSEARVERAEPGHERGRTTSASGRSARPSAVDWHAVRPGSVSTQGEDRDVRFPDTRLRTNTASPACRNDQGPSACEGMISLQAGCRPHVRFDERGLETRQREPMRPGAKARTSYRTLKLAHQSSTLQHCATM